MRAAREDRGSGREARVGDAAEAGGDGIQRAAIAAGKAGARREAGEGKEAAARGALMALLSTGHGAMRSAR